MFVWIVNEPVVLVPEYVDTSVVEFKNMTCTCEQDVLMPVTVADVTLMPLLLEAPYV